MRISPTMPSVTRAKSEDLSDQVWSGWRECPQGVSKDSVELYISMLNQGLNEIQEVFPVESRYASPEMIYVSWGDFVLSRRDLILATDGLYACSGFIIQNNNLQYVGHVLYCGTSVNDIRSSIEAAFRLGLTPDQICVMPGFEKHQITPAKILEAMKSICSGSQVKLVVSPHDDCQGQSVIVSSGKLFQYPQSWVSNFKKSSSFGVKRTLEDFGFQRLDYSSSL